MNHCPCGSTSNYSTCCGRYIDGAQPAGTPELLMRSRYSAYTLAKINYIKRTMSGNALIDFNPGEVKRWARQVKWLGLRVVQAYNVSENKGFVEFVAHFQDGECLQSIHEVSEFHRVEGIWFYVDGTHKK